MIVWLLVLKLEIIINYKYLEGFGFLLEALFFIFFKIIFLHGEIFEFP
jgi:hypothetical protein